MFCGTFWTIECFADYFHVYSGLSSWNARIGTPNYYLTLQSGKCYFCRSLEVCRLVQGRIQWAGSCLSPVASFLLHCSWPKASNWYDIILGVAGTFFLFFFLPLRRYTLNYFPFPKHKRKRLGFALHTLEVCLVVADEWSTVLPFISFQGGVCWNNAHFNHLYYRKPLGQVRKAPQSNVSAPERQA